MLLPCNPCLAFCQKNDKKDTFFNKLAQLSPTIRKLPKNAAFFCLNDWLLNGLDSKFFCYAFKPCKPIKIPAFRYQWKRGANDPNIRYKYYFRFDMQPILFFENLPNYRVTTLIERYEFERELKSKKIEKEQSTAVFFKKLQKETKYQVTTSPDYLEVLENFDIPKGYNNLEKKAYSKYLSYFLANELENIEPTFLKKSYTQTKYCCEYLIQEGLKLSGRYCKQRWCLVCNRIKTAKLINGYEPELKKFNEPYFLTTTIANVSNVLPDDDFNLRTVLKNMQEYWRTIYKKLYKHYKKTNTDFKLIKKVECTYNFEENTYHPHYHFVLEGENLGNDILQNWLYVKDNKFKYLKNKYGFEISPKGQKLKPVENEKGYLELFKYFTKIVTKTNEKETKNIQRKNSIYKETVKEKKEIIMPSALNVIFQSMAGRRVFEPVGISSVTEDFKDEDLAAQDCTANLIYEKTKWSWNGQDWQNIKNNNNLTGFEPNNKLIDLVSNIYY